PSITSFTYTTLFRSGAGPDEQGDREGAGALRTHGREAREQRARQAGPQDARPARGAAGQRYSPARAPSGTTMKHSALAVASPRFASATTAPRGTTTELPAAWTDSTPSTVVTSSPSTT